YGITLPEGPPDNERPVTGGELKIWRKKRGWSQQELAEKIGFTQGSIHYAESKPDHKLGSRLLSSLRMLSLEPPPPKTELLDDKI
ncbi:MAG TPA: helix-turn-helix transcriptional regulator, partial [Myxococcota bacterium]|nr:helix-turn-helix transcriptional regulator [Myxococcota bacterium]